MIGQTLSHFHSTAKLGKGGMAEVYSVEDTKLGREVLITIGSLWPALSLGNGCPSERIRLGIAELMLGGELPLSGGRA